MGKRASKRQARANKESNYIACMIANGPMPKGPSAKLDKYKVACREWWHLMNSKCDPKIKEAGLFRFWNRYHRWYQNMMTNERRNERVATSIVEGWVDDAPKEPGQQSPRTQMFTSKITKEDLRELYNHVVLGHRKHK